MLKKKNIFRLMMIVVVFFTVVREIRAGRGSVENSSTTPSASVDTKNSPDTSSSASTQDNQDPDSDYADQVLETLSDNKKTIATGVGSLAMMGLSTIVTKKVPEISFLNPPKTDSSAFFESSIGNVEEQKNTSNEIIKNMENLKEKKILGIFRTKEGKQEKEEAQAVLYNKLEREVAKSKANSYKDQRERLESISQALNSTSAKNTQETIPVDNTTEEAIPVDNTKEIDERQVKLNERKMVLAGLEEYYLKVSRGKKGQRLLEEHPKVKEEVEKNKTEFAKKIIVYHPNVYKNLSESKKKELVERIKASNERKTENNKPREGEKTK